MLGMPTSFEKHRTAPRPWAERGPFAGQPGPSLALSQSDATQTASPHLRAYRSHAARRDRREWN